MTCGTLASPKKNRHRQFLTVTFPPHHVKLIHFSTSDQLPNSSDFHLPPSLFTTNLPPQPAASDAEDEVIEAEYDDCEDDEVQCRASVLDSN